VKYRAVLQEMQRKHHYKVLKTLTPCALLHPVQEVRVALGRRLFSIMDGTPQPPVLPATADIDGEEVDLPELIDLMTQFLKTPEDVRASAVMQEAELLPDLRAWVAADCNFGAMGARGLLLKRALEGLIYPRPSNEQFSERLVNIGNSTYVRGASTEGSTVTSGKVVAVAQMRDDARHAGTVACDAQEKQRAAKAAKAAKRKAKREAKRKAKREAKALGEEADGEAVDEAGGRVGDYETPVTELARYEAEFTKEAEEDAATDKYSQKWRNVRAGIKKPAQQSLAKKARTKVCKLFFLKLMGKRAKAVAGPEYRAKAKAFEAQLRAKGATTGCIVAKQAAHGNAKRKTEKAKKGKGKSRPFDVATAAAAASAQAAAHVPQSATDYWNTSGKGQHAVGGRFTVEHVAGELMARGVHVERKCGDPTRSPSKPKKELLAQLAPWMEEDAEGNKLLLRMTDIEGHVKGAEQAWATLSSGRGGGGSGNSGGAKRIKAPGGDGTNKRRRGA
jgi:hypothetical protein